MAVLSFIGEGIAAPSLVEERRACQRVHHPAPARAQRQLGGASRKISATLLDHAQHYLESALTIAVAAWNAAIEQERNPRALGDARRALARDAGSAPMLERFPHDQRQVGRFEAVKKGKGELGVMMLATVAPDLNTRQGTARVARGSLGKGGGASV